MKCPKCGLVTFDHLSRCPKCQATFRLARRLTRRPDPGRRIVLPTDSPGVDGESGVDVVGDASGAAAAGEPDAERSDRGPATETAAPGPAVESKASHDPESHGDRRRDTGDPAGPSGEGRDAAPRPAVASATRTVDVDAGDDRDAPNSPTVAGTLPLDRADLAPAPASRAYDAPAPARPPAPPRTPEADRTTERRDAPTRDFSRYPLRRSADEHEADRRRMKERMIAASRERRGARSEASTGSVDPLLPDWYVPETDDNEAESEPATASRTE